LTEFSLIVYPALQIPPFNFKTVQIIRSVERMNKVDLIQALKDSKNLSKSEAEAVINLFFNKMVDALAQGDSVEIRVRRKKEYEKIYFMRNVGDSFMRTEYRTGGRTP
jgi:hypothetical protein